MLQALAALLLLAVGSAHAGTGRQLLQATAPSTAPAPAPSTALGPLATPLYELTASQAISLLCARTVTSVQYVNALLSHYDTGGWSCVNAFIGFNRTKVLEEAAAIDAKAAAGQSITPLCGLPLAVKDTIDVLGYPTSAATPALLGAFPSFEAPLVTTYRDANGIILGKMNPRLSACVPTCSLVELSSTVTGINVDANGITNPLNVYNQTRMPGGSSAGSAASVAARFAPWALCEDTGGSCRAPAMAQGIFGLRPTLGCYNFSDSLVPATFTRDTVDKLHRLEDLPASPRQLLASCTTAALSAQQKDHLTVPALYGSNLRVSAAARLQAASGAQQKAHLTVPACHDHLPKESRCCMSAGSFGRTAEDLVLLDSIIRSANATTDAVGASPDNIVSCAVSVDTNMSLAGLRIGLPSNFGWVNPGLSAEVQDIINNATAKLTAAGAVLVPFDSQVLNDASAMAWGGGLESYDYEDTDTLARCIAGCQGGSRRQQATADGVRPCVPKHTSRPACCHMLRRFLYRHNYSISVPEVYYAVNRPDLKLLYTSQLFSTDDTRLGSNTNWVHYLQTGRPNITEQWNNTFNKYNVDVFLYPGFATTIPEVDAAEPFIQLTNGSVVPSNNYNFFEIDAQATITGGSAGPGGSLRSSFCNQAPAAKCASEPKPGSRQQGWQIQGHQKPLFACSGTMAATAHLLLLHCPCRPASVVCGRLLAAPALAAAAALAFPIGFDAQGIPAGLQFAAPHGKDSLMLSLALAMEKLFGPMEPPSLVAGCAGCTVNTSAVPVTYTNTTVQPSANEVWSYFSLQFEGACNSNFLTDYGKNGILGMGVNHTQLYNTTQQRLCYMHNKISIGDGAMLHARRGNASPPELEPGANMVNPNVFTVPADLQQTLCKYKVLAAEYVYRPLSEAEAQDWSNAMCLDKMRQLDRWVQAALGALEWMRNERSNALLGLWLAPDSDQKLCARGPSLCMLAHTRSAEPVCTAPADLPARLPLGTVNPEMLSPHTSSMRNAEHSADRVVHTQQDVLETISRSIIETDKQHRDQLDTINQRFAERRQEIAKLTQEKRVYSFPSPARTGEDVGTQLTNSPAHKVASWSSGSLALQLLAPNPCLSLQAVYIAQAASAAFSMSRAIQAYAGQGLLPVHHTGWQCLTMRAGCNLRKHGWEAAGAHCQVAELQQKLEAAQAEAAALLSAAGRRGEELMRQHREAAAKTTALGDYGVNLHRHAAATWHGTANCQAAWRHGGTCIALLGDQWMVRWQQDQLQKVLSSEAQARARVAELERQNHEVEQSFAAHEYRLAQNEVATYHDLERLGEEKSQLESRLQEAQAALAKAEAVGGSLEQLQREKDDLAALQMHLAPPEPQWLGIAVSSLEQAREEAARSKASCRQLKEQLASAEKEKRDLEHQVTASQQPEQDETMAAADAPDEEPGHAPEVPRRAVEGLVATVPAQPVSVQRAAKRAAPAASVPEFDNEEIQDTPRLRKTVHPLRALYLGILCMTGWLHLEGVLGRFLNRFIGRGSSLEGPEQSRDAAMTETEELPDEERAPQAKRQKTGRGARGRPPKEAKETAAQVHEAWTCLPKIRILHCVGHICAAQAAAWQGRPIQLAGRDGRCTGSCLTALSSAASWAAIGNSPVTA
eukprot:jgi/Astpho2/7936/fgenesh1_pg.00118_%23_37_t